MSSHPRLSDYCAQLKKSLKDHTDRLDLLVKKLQENKLPDANDFEVNDMGWEMTWYDRNQSPVTLRWEWNEGFCVIDDNGSTKTTKKIQDPINALISKLK